MTLDDLDRTLTDALSTGKVGSPVALRLHLQLADSAADLAQATAALMRLAETVFSETPSRVTARTRDETPRQWNLLCNYPGGQTVQLTLGCGAAASSTLHLLLVGNHGVVRLEGAELFDDTSLSATDEETNHWQQTVEQNATGVARP
jgi:hypothetical protein